MSNNPTSLADWQNYREFPIKALPYTFATYRERLEPPRNRPGKPLVRRHPRGYFLYQLHDYFYRSMVPTRYNLRRTPRGVPRYVERGCTEPTACVTQHSFSEHSLHVTSPSKLHNVSTMFQPFTLFWPSQRHMFMVQNRYLHNVPLVFHINVFFIAFQKFQIIRCAALRLTFANNANPLNSQYLARHQLNHIGRPDRKCSPGI